MNDSAETLEQATAEAERCHREAEITRLIEEIQDAAIALDGQDDDKPKMSKRKMKEMTRLSVAELKQCVARPDVVEMHDVTAKDPKLLVLLKATRNTVPVPRHWCAKRKYLQVGSSLATCCALLHVHRIN